MSKNERSPRVNTWLHASRTISAVRALLILVLLSSALSGCWSRAETPAKANSGAGASATPRPGDRERDAGPQQTQPAPGRPVPPSVPGQGGVLRLFGADPTTLDPALAQDVSSWGYLLQIFSGLVALNDQLDIVPELAEDWGTDVSGRVYTFHLRKDAKFHDGRPVTAADFQFSFERATDPKLRSSVAELYLGDIVGVNEKLAGRASTISGIRVRDDYTFEVTTDAAKPYFLSKLTYPTAYVVDRGNVGRGGEWWRQPNGTGPFKMKSWTDAEIVLEASDLYYGKRPQIAEASFFVGGGSPIAMYERDEIDIAEVTAADVERVTDPNSPLNKELVVTPQLSIWYFGFNVKAKPFDDPKVRQAFNLATDKQRIVEVLLRNTGMVAEGILPPGMPGHSADMRGLPFDPDRARQLLAESSYRGPLNLPPITLTVGAGAGSRAQRFAEMYQRNLGLDTMVEQVDRGFFDDLNASRYQMFFVGWVADYPDPQDFLDILFHGASSGNHTGYSNGDVNRLLEQARVELDQPRRWQLYEQAERQIIADAPWVPLYHDVDHVLAKPRVKGLVWTPVGIISLKDVTVEPRAKPGTI